MSEGRHIRDEVATRIKYGLIGNGKELDADRTTKNLCVAWCTADTHGVEFFFHSVDHMLFELREHGGGITPCHDCLTVIRGLVEKELGTTSTSP